MEATMKGSMKTMEGTMRSHTLGRERHIFLKSCLYFSKIWQNVLG